MPVLYMCKGCNSAFQVDSDNGSASCPKCAAAAVKVDLNLFAGFSLAPNPKKKDGEEDCGGDCGGDC